MSILTESRSLGRERQSDGIFRLKLNIFSSPIVNKYREGKVQSTLERELNVPEIVAVQAVGRYAVSRRNLYSPFFNNAWSFGT